MSTSTRSDVVSRSDSGARAVPGEVLLDALADLWEKTRHQSEASKERSIEAYAEMLAPFEAQAVLRVLRSWGHTQDWWPTEHELRERLPDPDYVPSATALPAPQPRRSRRELDRLVDTALQSETGQDALREGWGRSLADWVEDHGNAYPTLRAVSWIKRGNREFRRSLGEQKDAGRDHLVRLGEAMLRREDDLRARYLVE